MNKRDYSELTVADARTQFESGELTSAALTKWYMTRIARIDQSGPRLNSVLELNPDALHLAAAMDRERESGKVRSPLHGIPVLLKDNINTADKLRTTAGSLALADNFAPCDAAITKKMRNAGLVILGKVNMTEFANFMSRAMKNGYSSRGGQVINPYNPEADVWGSSSGSAVAVSANLAMLAVGTETDGSIIWPSYMNGTVGIKPTHGLISRSGIIPICTSQDTAGPMARTVADAAALLNVLVGEDEQDPATWARQDRIPKDYTSFLNRDGLKGLRIGINRAYYDELSDEQQALCEAAYRQMEREGAILIQSADLPKFKCDFSVLLYEFKKCLNAYLATVHTRCRTLTDIINFYRESENDSDLKSENTNESESGPESEILKYGMDILLEAENNTSGNCTEPQYIEDRLNALKVSQTDGLDHLFGKMNLDILICPGDSDHAPISGYPAVSVPVGYDAKNIPYGISFTGLPYREPMLIQAAYAYEQASRMRKPPVWPDVR